jgi:hypothetical protein
MATPAELMAKRKGIVRAALAASDRGDKATYERLWKEAQSLMAEAGRLTAEGGTFTTQDAYGLMGS